jgi:hypothetical protein
MIMTRKRWTRQESSTPKASRSKDKRKWQITLRRYVLEQMPCPAYAPYFGLDIKCFREWIELQFKNGMDWSNFGEAWQFEHYVPIAAFNPDNDNELKLCWNFLNIKLSALNAQSDKLTLQTAKKYFESIYSETGIDIASAMLEKIKSIEDAITPEVSVLTSFLKDKRGHINQLRHFGKYEFELFNNGASMAEIRKESEFLKKLVSGKR